VVDQSTHLDLLQKSCQRSTGSLSSTTPIATTKADSYATMLGAREWAVFNPATHESAGIGDVDRATVKRVELDDVLSGTDFSIIDYSYNKKGKS